MAVSSQTVSLSLSHFSPTKLGAPDIFSSFSALLLLGYLGSGKEGGREGMKVKCVILSSHCARSGHLQEEEILSGHPEHQ